MSRKRTVLYDLTTCGLVNLYRRLFPPLLGYNPEAGGSIFLRNASEYRPDYTASNTKKFIFILKAVKNLECERV
jgi:hypothetical protein